MQGAETLSLPPQVELRYIPRSANLEPRVRLTVFRKSGCVLLDIRLSAIARICPPTSESQSDVFRAFRAAVPAMLAMLNAAIAKAPPGAIVFIGPADIEIRSRLAA
jgi:hypothetical protein